MLNCKTGAVIERTLQHQDAQVRDLYTALTVPVVVGIEATGMMGWFLQLMDELGISCRVGHPAAIRQS
jgi:hypothetical protein